MRKFEEFIVGRKVENGKDIIFIDLAEVKECRSRLEVQLGLKVKSSGMLCTAWHPFVIVVDDDFSVSEFLYVCGKHGIQCSAFLGDNK